MKFDLHTFLRKYAAKKSDSFAASKFLETFPLGSKAHKQEFQDIIDKKIENKDSNDLDFYLSLAWRDGLDESYKPIFKQLVLATWHNYHEDIVDYIRDLKDESFVEDLYKIATTEFPYRKYDDENESTLRKCVHAFKELNSTLSLEKIRLLEATENMNVKYVLEMYH